MEKIKRKAVSMLMAFLMCLSVIPMISTTVFAKEAQGGTAVLTIIKGLAFDVPQVTVNKQYDFEAGSTFADLLEAAKKDGAIQDFEFSGDYISSITDISGNKTANAADFSYYWSNYKNGIYASGTACKKTDILKDKDSFQLAYEGYPVNEAPVWSDVEVDSETAATVVSGTEENIDGSIVLKIVKGISFEGPSVITSKKYNFNKGATLGDLLAAAVTEGEIDGYNFSWGYLDSITPKSSVPVTNKSDYSSYWSVYKNGQMCMGETDGKEDDLLSDNGSFEYSWEDYPLMKGLDKDSWTDLSNKAEKGKTTVKDEKPKANNEKTNINSLNENTEKAFKTLYENMLTKEKGSYDFPALALIGADRASDVNTEKIIENAKNVINDPKYSDIQKAIILLSAIGKNPSNLEGNDLIEILSGSADLVPAWTEGPSYTLDSYGAVPEYGIPSNKPNSPGKLIEKLKDMQCDDGGFGFMGSSSPDSTGAALAGLSCYSDNKDAMAMVKSGIDSLKESQNKDGGFGYAKGADSNADSTAMAIIGLCAAGIDPTGTDFTTKGGNNPITALLSMANKDFTDMNVDVSNIDITRSNVTLALAAYQGLRNTKKAYNIYTQAKNKEAVYKAPEVPKTLDSNQINIWVIIMALSMFAAVIVLGNKYLNKTKER